MLGSARPLVSPKDFIKIKIPLPPLEVQKEIVEQIEVKQKAIDHAKAVIESLEKERRYFGQALRNLEGVEWVELGEVAKFKQGKQVDKDLHIKEEREGYSRFIRIIDYTQNNTDIRYIPTPTGDVFCNEEELIMVRYGQPGLVGRGIKGVFANNLFKIDFQENAKISLDFAYYILNSEKVQNYIKGNLQVSGLPAINHSIVKKIKIPLPPLEIQKQLVAEAEKEEEIITANRRLIEIMERKIEEVLSNI
jgi:restriction endonuclease S subunit